MNIEPAITFDDVLIVPQLSNIVSRKDIKIPNVVIPSNMDTITGIKMVLQNHNIDNGVSIFPRYAPIDSIKKVCNVLDAIVPDLFFSVGVKDFEIVKYVQDHTPYSICIDVAHGHSQQVINFISKCRDRAIDKTIIAGNVCTPDGARDLFYAGAEIVKVGVGNGSACSTRIKTGCGYPQLQAIIDINQAMPEIEVICDGGIKSPGDAAKAIAAGASYVMLGGMLAGTDCVPDWDVSVLSSNMVFKGMASLKTKEEYGLPLEHEEGISTIVPRRGIGSTRKVITEVLEGIKSAMSYVGTKTILDFQDFSKFVRVSNNTVLENRPHILERK